MNGWTGRESLDESECMDAGRTDVTRTDTCMHGLHEQHCCVVRCTEDQDRQALWRHR